MAFNIKQSILLVALLVFPFNTYASYNTLLKARIGYADLKPSINDGSKGTAGQQKIKKGAITEIALAKFLTSNIAAELGVGYGFIKTRANGETSEKKSNMVPLSGVVQFHVPIVNKVVPYAGIGYLYNIFYNTNQNLKIKKAGNLVYQAGVDLFIFDDLGINLDLKYSKIKHKISDNGEDFKAKVRNLSMMAGIAIPL